MPADATAWSATCRRAACARAQARGDQALRQHDAPGHRLAQHIERGVGQRYAMFATAFHPLGGYGPHSLIEIDLAPARAVHFTTSCRGQEPKTAAPAPPPSSVPPAPA